MVKPTRSRADTIRICGLQSSTALAVAITVMSATQVRAQETQQTTLPTWQQSGNTVSSSDSADAVTLDPATPLRQEIDQDNTTSLQQIAAQSVTSQQDSLDLQNLGRQNLREQNVDGTYLQRPRRTTTADDDGIRVGTFILRPSLSERLLSETTKTGSTKEDALYSATTLKGTLTSDWSQHQLIISGDGTYEKLVSGEGQTDPTANIDAQLRLDIGDASTLTFSGGYSFSREDAEDADAVANAQTQYGIHRFDAGVEAAREVGILRGSVGLEGSRWLYTDAVLNDGTDYSLADRQRTLGTLRGRIGYELSPALVPFIELSTGRLFYDQKQDSSGYERSANIYTAKSGVEVDLGDKLRGEFAVGYVHENFDDDRLDDLNGLTVDGTATWSPRYGTDVTLGLTTSLDPTTTAGTGGAIVYAGTAAVAQTLRDDLVATLSGTTTWTHYPELTASDTTAYQADAVLAYELNRYLALTAGLGYEYTDRKSSADTEILRASVGITAKR